MEKLNNLIGFENFEKKIGNMKKKTKRTEVGLDVIKESLSDTELKSLALKTINFLKNIKPLVDLREAGATSFIKEINNLIREHKKLI